MVIQTKLLINCMSYFFINYHINNVWFELGNCMNIYREIKPRFVSLLYHIGLNDFIMMPCLLQNRSSLIELIGYKNLIGQISTP